MGDTVDALAYDEARSAIAAQQSALDGLRARAGTLLAAAALVTSFLGGQVLTKPTVTARSGFARASIGGGGWSAIALFAALALLTLAILWPYEWRFEMSATTILSVEPDGDIAAVRSQLATYHEQNYDLNKLTLDRLFTCFRLACVCLVGETIL